MDSPANIQGDQHAEPQEKIKSTIDELLTAFSEDCQRLGIKHAAIIVRDPGSNHPKVYLHGHLYDVGVMLNTVTQKVRAELLDGLN
jgi:putative aminopeptidase FrvX